MLLLYLCHVVPKSITARTSANYESLPEVRSRREQQQAQTAKLQALEKKKLYDEQVRAKNAAVHRPVTASASGKKKHGWKK